MPDNFTFLSRYLRAFLNERPLKVCLYVRVSQRQISYNSFNNVFYFSFYYKDDTVISLRGVGWSTGEWDSILCRVTNFSPFRCFKIGPGAT